MTYNKEYYENNKDKFREYKRRTLAKKKSEASIEEELNKRREYAKIYYRDNKEYFTEYNKNNKDKLKIKIQCECGSIVSKGSFYSHKKTEKHINRMIIKEHIPEAVMKTKK